MRVVAPLQQRCRRRVRVGGVEEAVELGLREVGDEAGERVAFHRRGQRLAHHGGADHHAQRVEGHFGLVAVRVADQARLQHAVVVGVHRDAVAERVAGFDHQQVVGVEIDEGVLAEGVAVAAWQEEVRRACANSAAAAVGGIRAEERLPGGNPPVIVGVARGEAAVGLEHLALQIAALVAGLAAEHRGRIGQQGLGGWPWRGRWKTWASRPGVKASL